MPITSFMPLTVCSQYSLQHSVIRLPNLLERCAEYGYAACGLCDVMNVFGAVQFQSHALRHGIKPLLGATLQVRDSGATGETGEYTVTLLCMNATGYHRLCQLLSMAYRQQQDGLSGGFATLNSEQLRKADLSEGLIMIVDVQGIQSCLGERRSEACLQAWQSVWGDRLYLAITRYHHPKEQQANQWAAEWAVKYQLPLVAIHPVRFLSVDDFQAHKVKYGIQEGVLLAQSDHDHHFTDQQYLPKPEEMAERFKDLPEALANTVEIAKRCNFLLSTGVNHLPDFPTAEGTTIDEALTQAAQAGLDRFLASSPQVDGEAYQARLMTELTVIHNMGFSGYFMIVADFIQWAKQQRIPVGPGRGSGAGSLVAYALSITDIDPMAYGLLFERFLNPERVSMPDFDIDFCMHGRDRVIDYVAERYGRDSVAQIITFGTLAAKAVVRDVGRTLGYPYGFVDKIARLIPNQLGINLQEAMAQEPDLQRRYQQEEEVTQLMDVALKLEGLVRNVGKHAGGVVIAPCAMEHFTPIYIDPENASVVTQLDKDDVEKIGLVKFDFLGLRTLTVIDQAIQNIRRAFPDREVSIHRIPLDDGRTFHRLCSGMTTAVFQLESYGMQALLKRLHPDRFEDIVALVALYRPGPLQSGMVDDFIERKHGRAPIDYPHPCLQAILEPTYGVILYQEQVMQIAQELSGYTLGGADILRRAMGKKKPEEMARQRSTFIEGATNRGHDAELANQIFDLIEKFAGYGFNKSHSVAYALLTYQTAWLKAHYPAYFMASVLSADLDNTDKLAHLVQDCRQGQLEVLPPSINSSEVVFTVVSDRQICYGLAALKGVGRSLAEEIVEKRGDQPYQDLLDLCRRLDRSHLNRRALESLGYSGAFDEICDNRACVLASIDRAIKLADRCYQTEKTGQMDLFSGSKTHALSAFEWVNVRPWSTVDQLNHELTAIGFYLSGHPMSAYRPEMRAIGAIPLIDCQRRPKRGQSTMIAGIISDQRTLLAKSNDRVIALQLEDETCSLEVTIYGENCDRYRHCLVKKTLVIAQVLSQADAKSERVRHTARALYTLDDIRQQYQPALHIVIDAASWQAKQADNLKDILKTHEGGCHRVVLAYRSAGQVQSIALSDQRCLHFNDDLVSRLREIDGIVSCYLHYSGT